MAVKIYHGDILFTPAADQLSVYENSYIIVEDGVVSQICERVPEEYKGAEVVDYGDKLIIPAFSDLHVHGSQYVQRGIGMDCLLSDWLNHYTFPQESQFRDMDYAKESYDAFVDDMLRHGTFHANVFATIHREATDYLFDKTGTELHPPAAPFPASDSVPACGHTAPDPSQFQTAPQTS